MKKFLCAFLALVLLVSALTACTPTAETTGEAAASQEPTDISPIVEITPEPVSVTPTPEPTPTETPEPELPVITPTPEAAEATASPEAETAAELRYTDDRIGRIMDDTERFAASPRLAGSDAEKDALDYAASVFSLLGLTVSRQEVTRSGEYAFSSYNIIGTRKAASDNAPILILAAHADSVEWDNGATDNAAGLATLLEAARQISLVAGDAVEIRFIAFTAEEWQAYGAKQYLAALSEGEKSRIRGMLNIDLFSSASASLVYAYFESHDLCYSLWEELTNAAARTGNTLFLTRSNELMSDAMAFEEAGIPAVLLTHGVVEGEYHTENDTVDKIDQQKLLYALTISVEWLRSGLAGE